MPDLVIRPLTPRLMDAMGRALKGSWGATCWCLYPRMSDREMRDLPGDGLLGPRRRVVMARLACKRRAPGLLAFDGDTPLGWIAVAPRAEFARVAGSRATPPLDDVDVWVVPCVTVVKGARGRGIAVRLIKAAADYAFAQGAPAVEAYPRAGTARAGDDSAFFGTEPLFARAGFRVVRGPIAGLPRNWTPRVTMRREPTD